MSTRGWLIFKYKGQYYVIYNQWDSYPSGMGLSIAKQIVALIVEHHGCVTDAREHWAELFAKLTFVEEYQSSSGTPDHPFSSSAYEDIHEKLMFCSAPVVLEKDPSDHKPQSDGLFIEYLWEIDLDKGKLGMGSSESGTVFVYWSWKSIYRLGPKVFAASAEEYAECAEKTKTIAKTTFREQFLATLIQTQVRRFLCVRRALTPPDGVLYLLAKRRFEKKQQLQAADAAAIAGRKRSIEETVCV